MQGAGVDDAAAAVAQAEGWSLPAVEVAGQLAGAQTRRRLASTSAVRTAQAPEQQAGDEAAGEDRDRDQRQRAFGVPEVTASCGDDSGASLLAVG